MNKLKTEWSKLVGEWRQEMEKNPDMEWRWRCTFCGGYNSPRNIEEIGCNCSLLKNNVESVHNFVPERSGILFIFREMEI